MADKIEIKKVYKGFDVASFEETKIEKTIEFTPADTYQDAVARLGNDQSVLLNALNDALRAKALSEARPSGIPKSVMLNFLKPFRGIPPFNSMVTLEKGQIGWKDQYNLQTTALIAQAKKTEFMAESIRAAAEIASVDEDDDVE